MSRSSATPSVSRKTSCSGSHAPLSRRVKDFMFRLSRAETAALNRSHSATGSQRHRDPRFSPYAFTEGRKGEGSGPCPQVSPGSTRISRLGLAAALSGLATRERPAARAASCLHLRQRHLVGQHRAPLDRNDSQAGLFIRTIPAVHGEVRACDSERRSRDGVGEPVRVVLEALVAGGGAQAITEEAPHPPIVVVA